MSASFRVWGLVPPSHDVGLVAFVVDKRRGEELAARLCQLLLVPVLPAQIETTMVGRQLGLSHCCHSTHESGIANGGDGTAKVFWPYPPTQLALPPLFRRE